MTDRTATGTPPIGTPHTASDRAALPMAIMLWILVVGALTYGVVQTLNKVVALFG